MGHCILEIPQCFLEGLWSFQLLLIELFFHFYEKTPNFFLLSSFSLQFDAISTSASPYFQEGTNQLFDKFRRHTHSDLCALHL